MVIMPDALPGLKRFLKPVGLNKRMMALAIRCIATFVIHLGRILMKQPTGTGEPQMCGQRQIQVTWAGPRRRFDTEKRYSRARFT
jgi:hypothetical protein